MKKYILMLIFGFILFISTNNHYIANLIPCLSAICAAISGLMIGIGGYKLTEYE